MTTSISRTADTGDRAAGAARRTIATGRPHDWHDPAYQAFVLLRTAFTA